MSRRLRLSLPILLLVSLTIGLFAYKHHRQPTPELPAPSMQQEPTLMLWAWETPEDLTTLNPQTAGVAFLARELLLTHQLTVRPRRQPLQVAPGTWLVAVVRIELAPGFIPDADTVHRSALAIAEAAQLPHVRALQIDFDATATQRELYRNLLHQLHQHLPQAFPVSMTALVSWCGPHSWLQSLQIDEAVPMFFRMGGPTATRAAAPRSQSAIAEPRCSGSVGLSTDEAWSVVRPNQRVYLFRPGSWTRNDLARINRFGYQSLRGLTPP